VRKKRISRRDFGRQAALTMAAGALTSAGTLSPPVQADMPEVSPGARAEIDRKLRHIYALYGDSLSDEQRKKLRGVVTDHVRMLDRVRAIKLHNSDPPAAVLKLIDSGSTGS
jgi:hypothetical protein